MWNRHDASPLRVAGAGCRCMHTSGRDCMLSARACMKCDVVRTYLCCAAAAAAATATAAAADVNRLRSWPTHVISWQPPVISWLPVSPPHESCPRAWPSACAAWRPTRCVCVSRGGASFFSSLACCGETALLIDVWALPPRLSLNPLSVFSLDWKFKFGTQLNPTYDGMLLWPGAAHGAQSRSITIPITICCVRVVFDLAAHWLASAGSVHNG